MIITDHMARSVIVIGCLSRSSYYGHNMVGTNQSFITKLVYSVYLKPGKRFSGSEMIYTYDYSTIVAYKPS